VAPWAQAAGRGGCALALLLRVLCCLLLAAAPAGATEVYAASAVKAAFVYRFAGFITWPPDADNAARFTIAVWGANDVADELQQNLPQLTIGHRAVDVRRVQNARDLALAQLVYCGAGHRAELRRAAATTAGKPILLVSDDADGLEDGSAINLLLIERRVRFEISVAALQRNGLKASSELLALAIRVHGPGAAHDKAGGSP
jgi:hypothetical protein